MSEKPIRPARHLRRTGLKHAPLLQSKNLLEILSGLKVPDGVLTVLLTFLSALTLAPYLGGRALWILGGNPVVIPTLSEQLFWTIIIITPYIWMLALGRIFHASKFKIAVNLFSASAVTAALVTIHSFYPIIGLTAIDSSYLEEHEVSAWYLTAAHEDAKYKYFRSEPINLELEKGCALRIERIELSASGWANIENSTSGFDIQIFASTSELLAPTFKSHQDRNNSATMEASMANTLRNEPTNAEVKGRSTVRINSTDLINENHINLNITYDFIGHTTKVEPGEYSKKKLERSDLVIRNTNAKLQLVGWTLYGDEVELTINDPIIRVTGKEHCSLPSWVLRQTN